MEEKKKKLEERLAHYTKKDVLVAFSGGVDSALLLKFACISAKKNRTKVYAAAVQTVLHPQTEIQEAKQIAESLGARFIVLEINEFLEADISQNPVDRCYRCKKTMFQKLVDKAKEYGVDTILEGTNQSDLSAYRPGIQALKELNICSPLVEAGLSKDEIRLLAKCEKLEVAAKPSTPCLATRFPYNTKLDEQALLIVEQGEAYMKELGFYNVRLRVYDKLVRIEVDETELEKLLYMRREVTEKLKQLGYDYVTLDLEGFRSGSMDFHIK